jgi:uncharacterized protein YkwD
MTMAAVALAAAAFHVVSAHGALPAAQSEFRIDEDAERELVHLANEERAQAGIAKLETDERITQTARVHARHMAERGELSHQFPGELPLMQRLSQGDLRFNAAAENVSSSESAADSHAGIMRSPPHRANLLNPRYNGIGVGVVRRGGLIYVAQNFVHRLPERTAAEAEEVITGEFQRARRRLKIRDVAHASDPVLRAAACDMARTDRPSASAAPAVDPPRKRTVVAYTASAPEELPDAVEKLARNGDVRSYSLGACFARSASYPSGTFWVLAIFEF